VTSIQARIVRRGLTSKGFDEVNRGGIFYRSRPVRLVDAPRLPQGSIAWISASMPLPALTHWPTA